MRFAARHDTRARHDALWVCKLKWNSSALFVRKSPALVAQLDRAPDFESGGRGFESLRARQSSPDVFDIPAVGDTGRLQAGDTRGTQIDRALEANADWPSRAGAMGLQRVVTPKRCHHLKRTSAVARHPPPAANVSGVAIGFIPAASNRGCEANIKS